MDMIESVDLVVLDVDGVIVDVENSYRRAILDTIEQLFNKSLPDSSIQKLKNAGGFNNDWDVTYALAFYVLAMEEGFDQSLDEWVEMLKAEGGGLGGAKTVVDDALGTVELGRIYQQWNPDQMRNLFQQLYLGKQLFEKIENKPAELNTKGLILSEPVIINSKTIENLKEQVQLGILTGRPKIEAQIALRRADLDTNEDLIYTMDDWKFGKPDPRALIAIAEQAGASKILYIGDTLDDIATAENAESDDPERKYLGVGVLTGGLSGEEGRELFFDAGAEQVLGNINELPDILS